MCKYEYNAWPAKRPKTRMTTHEYLPEEWSEFQSRLIRNHRELWKTINKMEYQEAVPFLNALFGTSVRNDATFKEAGKVFLNELLKREGTIVLPFGKGYSK